MKFAGRVAALGCAVALGFAPSAARAEYRPFYEMDDNFPTVVGLTIALITAGLPDLNLPVQGTIAQSGCFKVNMDMDIASSLTSDNNTLFSFQVNHLQPSPPNIPRVLTKLSFGSLNVDGQFDLVAQNCLGFISFTLGLTNARISTTQMSSSYQFQPYVEDTTGVITTVDWPNPVDSVVTELLNLNVDLSGIAGVVQDPARDIIQQALTNVLVSLKATLAKSSKDVFEALWDIQHPPPGCATMAKVRVIDGKLVSDAAPRADATPLSAAAPFGLVVGGIALVWSRRRKP